MEQITIESVDLFLILVCAVSSGIILGFGLGWNFGFASGHYRRIVKSLGVRNRRF